MPYATSGSGGQVHLALPVAQTPCSKVSNSPSALPVKKDTHAFALGSLGVLAAVFI